MTLSMELSREQLCLQRSSKCLRRNSDGAGDLRHGLARAHSGCSELNGLRSEQPRTTHVLALLSCGSHAVLNAVARDLPIE
jgi:hypothetical protein